MKKNTPRRDIFPKEFLVDLNATRAAKRCGYSRRTARQAGARLLSKVDIQKAIRGLMKERADRLDITAEEWLRELWLICKSDLKDYFRIDEGGAITAKMFEEMPEGLSRALESIEETRTIRESSSGDESNIVTDKVKFKLHCKIPALELVGKHLGFFKDRTLNLNVTTKLSLADMKRSLKEVDDGD